uniref:Uncharacterized protein n=1 Tax=Romanomermis culicivorax TaxID=13658 RepID=A0A915J1F5_ROMCU
KAIATFRLSLIKALLKTLTNDGLPTTSVKESGTFLGINQAVAVGKGDASMMLMSLLMAHNISKGIGDLGQRISRRGHWLLLGNYCQRLGSCPCC